MSHYRSPFIIDRFTFSLLYCSCKSYIHLCYLFLCTIQLTWRHGAKVKECSSDCSKDSNKKSTSNQEPQENVVEAKTSQTTTHRSSTKGTWPDWLIISLKFSLWLLVWNFFIELRFGSVFFVVSFLFFIYFTTQSKPRTDGSPSAYSVFNPNCESIDGTLKAEQFESELRYGPGSVH